MKRRTFLIQSTVLTTGFIAANTISVAGFNAETQIDKKGKINVYQSFKLPDSKYHPFVRWWWNGDKIDQQELIRELHLLKEAGIGGVEINPIEFPSTGDDLGKKSLTWLSNEWIDMLEVTFAEAKKLDMTCDLIVGSGWPFGSETLPREERAQVAIIYAETLNGPISFETSQFNIFKTVDPGVSVPMPSRTFEILSLKMVPEPMAGLDQVVDLSNKRLDEVISIDVPEGKHVLYALVKVDSFASVINGAPGAAGPILDHMNKAAVQKYLDHMSYTIQEKTGPLSNHLRAFFTDSMELEGSNWTADLPLEFEKRRGYDIMPYLPFIMFKVGRLGATVDANYGVTKTPEFNEILKRIRFDFEYTKAELLYERFTQTYLQWCKDQNVKSRAQAYGRGFFPLKTSLGYDIPEGESWTTNWLKHRVGEEMSDEDYRRGRGYTMINKYVSSAAHLTGKRLVSCEEMTNTYNVFNITLEQLKIGSDMSIMSGITHSIWHGFNYSPPEAPFPGWVQYGSYYSEKNNWWPYFKYLNKYKARLSALLQNVDMYTDMAILPANYDMWGEMGVQTDPFPEKLNVSYTSIIWESINKTGGAADYVTEYIIQDAKIKKGKLCYGPKEYDTLFLAEVSSMNSDILEKLLEFVSTGGLIFCIEKYPEKSLGLENWEQRDREVKTLVAKLREFSDRFILIKKPEDNQFLEWYSQLILKYNLPHYLTIEKPNRFFMQTRFTDDEKNELFFFQNIHLHDRYKTNVTFSKVISKGRYPWVWDIESGERFRIQLNNDSFEIDLGPAETRVLAFSKDKQGTLWSPLPLTGNEVKAFNQSWKVELQHSLEDSVKTFDMDELTDLKDTDYERFTGTAIYRKKINASAKTSNYLNLGKVWGVSELFVNGQSCGVKWYGNRIYNLKGIIKEGSNDIEVRVTTSMGNYMKTLEDNETAQKFLILKNKNQDIQSMGLIGPVTLYQ